MKRAEPPFLAVDNVIAAPGLLVLFAFQSELFGEPCTCITTATSDVVSKTGEN